MGHVGRLIMVAALCAALVGCSTICGVVSTLPGCPTPAPTAVP